MTNEEQATVEARNRWDSINQTIRAVQALKFHFSADDQKATIDAAALQLESIARGAAAQVRASLIAEAEALAAFIERSEPGPSAAAKLKKKPPKKKAKA